MTGDGTQLSAECTAATNPAIEVGGNVTISGNPGTNAYTVKAYNKYATQRGRDDNLRPSQMPSAFEISGNLSISGSAQVMAQTDSDGAAVWMPKQKVISVVDASLFAQNSSHNFSTISFGDESDTGNIYAKGQNVRIVAENKLHNSSLVYRAIKPYIYNGYSTGDSNPYYINVVSEGVQSGVNVIPGHCTSTSDYKITITRGDAYVAPTKTITEIIVTGLTPPVKGATPVDKSKVTLTEGLTVESITWGPDLTSDGKFAADTSYTAHIKYSVNAGYELAANANYPRVAGADVTRWHQEGMPQDEIEVTFPKTGGGSTHQHTWDTTKWYSVGDDYHAHKCTGCDEYDLTNKQAHYAWPDEDKGSEGHTEKCMLCDYKYDQSVIKPHEWTGWWVSDYQPEVHAQRCNCGYQDSVHSTLKYVAIDSNYHQKQCPVDGCGYKIEYKTSHVYEEGSNICTECGYDKSAPCDHTGDRAYTNNGDGTHKVTCKACGATLFEKQNHEFDPATGACVCGATQSGGNPTPDNPGTIVIIRPAEEEKPAQQPNPSTGANDLVGLAVAAAVAAALGSAALLRKHD